MKTNRRQKHTSRPIATDAKKQSARRGRLPKLRIAVALGVAALLASGGACGEPKSHENHENNMNVVVSVNGVVVNVNSGNNVVIQGDVVVTTEKDVVDSNDRETSLREAIEVARDGDTITFAPSLAGKTIYLDPKRGELCVRKRLVIDASSLASQNRSSSKSSLTIDGQKKSRVLHAFAKLTVRCVAITNGKTETSGGGIYCEDALKLENCSISNNAAEEGGAVCCSAGSSLTNCSFTGNSAKVDGGGVRCDGDLKLTNCVISNNSSGNSGGGICSDGVLKLTNCTVVQNSAKKNGGGIVCRAKCSLTNCTITGNSAKAVGGGIRCEGDIALTNVTVDKNSATSSKGISREENAKIKLVNTTIQKD